LGTPNEKILSTLVSFSVTDETPKFPFKPANTIAATAFAAGIITFPTRPTVVIISGGGYGSDLSSVSNNIEYTTDGINFAPILGSEAFRLRCEPKSIRL
jgi:hypothetical protein